MHVEPHLPLEELKRLERVEKDADRSRRLRIVILGNEGWTAPAVAMAVGLSRRICQRWVARYNIEGLAGLDDRDGQESELPLAGEQVEAFRQRLAAGPTAEDLVGSLRGKDFQRILAEEFNLLRSLSSVYWLLHRLGYSYLRPRPRHRKGGGGDGNTNGDFDSGGDTDGADFLHWQRGFGATHGADELADWENNFGNGSSANEIPLDFSQVAISDYFDQTSSGSTATISDAGATLTIAGNAWKSIPFNHTITLNTVIEFDYESPIGGEIHAIGFDNDNVFDTNRTLRFHGT